MAKTTAAYEATATMRVMRRLMLFTIPVAVVIAITMAVGLQYAVLSIGFVPMLYTYLLWGFLKRLEVSGRHLNKYIVAFLDLFGAILYLSACIPLWAGRIRAAQVFGNEMWGWGVERLRIEKGMLVAYCSSIYLLNMVIHVWLSLWDVKPEGYTLFTWDGKCSKCRHCPHCRDEDEAHGRRASGPRQIRADRGAAYSLLGEMPEDDNPVDNPRASGEA